MKVGKLIEKSKWVKEYHLYDQAGEVFVTNKLLDLTVYHSNLKVEEFWCNEGGKTLYIVVKTDKKQKKNDIEDETEEPWEL